MDGRCSGLRSAVCLAGTLQQPLPLLRLNRSRPLAGPSRAMEVARPQPSRPGMVCRVAQAPALLSERCRASREASKPPPVTSRAARAPPSFAFFNISAAYWIRSDSYLQPFCSLSVLIAGYTTTRSRNYIAHSLLLIDWQGN